MAYLFGQLDLTKLSDIAKKQPFLLLALVYWAHGMMSVMIRQLA